MKVEKENYNIDPLQIGVTIGTEWVSQFNITEVSKVNDPNAKLILYNNVKQSYYLPEGNIRSLNLEVLNHADIYKKEPEFFYKEVRQNLSTEDVDISISLGSAGEILRKVDFSDLSKRSYIDYNVTYITIVNITYSSEKSIEQIHQQYPELTKIQMPLLGNDVPGLIPLVNSTGEDDTSCNIVECFTNTEPSSKYDSYNLFDTITVYNGLDIDVASSFSVEKNVDGKNLYSAISLINLQYKVVIGEHRC
ncbi:unnamed protein product [Psylliodes chrysocephalus]|uniref:Uncharacterized protein n=1 Tax=Psylliodes chrysocephalus TaxID=3402493 RepID=A0A9P0CHW8_9CUCU|nr:unnamed protein product [Psylliodes chrysocephala]